MSEIKSIELAPNQLVIQKQLIDDITSLEALMIVVIDVKQPAMISDILSQATSLLGITGLIMERAKMIHDHAMGLVAIEIMENKMLNGCKQQLMIAYIKGKTAKWSALYDRAETTCKALNTFIDGLRSLLSYEKEQMKNLSYTQT